MRGTIEGYSCIPISSFYVFSFPDFLFIVNSHSNTGKKFKLNGSIFLFLCWKPDHYSFVPNPKTPEHAVLFSTPTQVTSLDPAALPSLQFPKVQ